MRAFDQAHTAREAVVTQKSADRALLMLLVATVSLLLVWRPSVVHAQESRTAAKADASGTQPHVVRASETLWSIAARYYGDGHAWRELARRNGITVSGDKAPITVGQTLRVPAKLPPRGPKAAAVAAAPADSTVPRAAVARAGEGTMPAPPAAPATAASAATSPAGSLAAQTAGIARDSTERAAARQAARQAVRPSADDSSTRAAAAGAAAGAVEPAGLTPQRGTLLGTPSLVRIGLASSAEQAASRKPNDAPTIFHRDLPDAAEAERRTRAVLRPNTPVPRQGELDAAPFLAAGKTPPAGGAILARVDAPSANPSMLSDAMPASLTLATYVELRAPAGRTLAVGDRLQAVSATLVPSLGKHVVVPTGIIEVTQVEGARVVGVVRRVSGRLTVGQTLLAAPPTVGDRGDVTTLPSSDLSTSVQWVDLTESMPTIGSFVVLTAGTAQQVRAGDEFALGAGATTIARARVVRVDATGATAVVVQQNAAGITTELAARRVRRAP